MNTPSDQANRYAAPKAEVEDIGDDSKPGELADRGSRLAAALLDFTVGALLVLPAAIQLGMPGVVAFAKALIGERLDLSNLDFSSIKGALIYMGVGSVVVLVAQLYFVVKNRQTIGKKLIGIKVTRSDGSEVSLSRLLFLRNVVNGLPRMIPVVGRLYQIVDVLFIFGEQRRCIHDYIADTIVVKA